MRLKQLLKNIAGRPLHVHNFTRLKKKANCVSLKNLLISQLPTYLSVEMKFEVIEMIT